MQVTDKPHRGHPNVPADLQPGRVFVSLDEELDNFERESRRFRGDEDGLLDEFRPFRLMQGVYGQRQENTQMIRVKLPYGGVSSDQMEACAVLAEKHSGYRRGHITTRAPHESGSPPSPVAPATAPAPPSMTSVSSPG